MDQTHRSIWQIRKLSLKTPCALSETLPNLSASTFAHQTEQTFDDDSAVSGANTEHSVKELLVPKENPLFACLWINQASARLFADDRWTKLHFDQECDNDI